jgi:aspartyl-tRNA synthetase
LYNRSENELDALEYGAPPHGGMAALIAGNADWPARG